MNRLVFGLFLVFFSCSAIDVAAQQPDLTGLWHGKISHGEQVSDFAIRVEETEEGEAKLEVSMPAIGAFDVFIGQAKHEGNRLTLGSWSVTFDPDTQTLNGIIPEGIAPVYRIPFTLARVEQLPAIETTPPSPVVGPGWRFDTEGPVWAGVAVADNVVYAADDAGHVYALDSREGSSRWTVALSAPVRATPTVSGNGLYLHTDSGEVMRLDRRTGDVDWRTRVGKAVERIPPNQPDSRYDNYASSVNVHGELALVGLHEGAVVALDAATGEKRWRRRTSGPVLGTPTTDSHRVYFTTFTGHLGALHAVDGALDWRVETSGPITSAASLGNGRIVVGNRSYDLLGLDAESGNVIWRHYYWFSWVESTATIVDDVAYVGSSDAQRLNAIAVSDGELLWSYRTGGWTWATPAVADGVVYVGVVGADGYMTDHRTAFHAVDAQTGKGLWHFEAERPRDAALWGFASSPAADGERAYVGSLDGSVISFDVWGARR